MGKQKFLDPSLLPPLEGLLLTTDTTRLHLLYLLEHDRGEVVLLRGERKPGRGWGGVFSLSI